jgi:hypothetical protein
MAVESGAAQRIVVLVGNDGECRCDKIRSPWGGRTTHLRSQCSPDSVTDHEVILRRPAA